MGADPDENFVVALLEALAVAGHHCKVDTAVVVAVAALVEHIAAAVPVVVARPADTLGFAAHPA